MFTVLFSVFCYSCNVPSRHFSQPFSYYYFYYYFRLDAMSTMHFSTNSYLFTLFPRIFPLYTCKPPCASFHCSVLWTQQESWCWSFNFCAIVAIVVRLFYAYSLLCTQCRLHWLVATTLFFHTNLKLLILNFCFFYSRSIALCISVALTISEIRFIWDFEIPD